MTSLGILCNTLFPAYCLGCGAAGSPICSRCYLHFIRYLPHCFLCGRINSGFDLHKTCSNSAVLSSYTCWRSNKYTRRVMRRINKGLAFRGLYHLTDLCIENLKTTSFVGKLNGARIVPLPTSRKDYLKKGFDSAEIIGKRLADRFDLEYTRSPGSGKVLLVSDVLKPKNMRRYLRNFKAGEVYSLSLFRRQLINKVGDMDPIDP
jgi:predicted amidophosphoribosyltransferase